MKKMLKSKKFANVVLTAAFLVGFFFFFNWGMKIDAEATAIHGAKTFWETCQMVFAYALASSFGGFLLAALVYLVFFSREKK